MIWAKISSCFAASSSVRFFRAFLQFRRKTVYDGCCCPLVEDELMLGDLLFMKLRLVLDLEVVLSLMQLQLLLVKLQSEM